MGQAHTILNRTCLPVPPLRHMSFNVFYFNMNGEVLIGFAVTCLDTGEFVNIIVVIVFIHKGRVG